MLPINVVLGFSPREEDKLTLTSLPWFLPPGTQAWRRYQKGWSHERCPQCHLDLQQTPLLVGGMVRHTLS